MTLGKFFDQWFHSPGYPSLDVTFSHDAKIGQGTFVIKQTQADKEKGIPVFDLDLDIAWTVDGEQSVLRVRVDKESNTYVVAMQAPEHVRIDPNVRTLMKLAFNPGDDMLKAQLSGASDVVGRIRAGQELVKTGKHENIQAVIKHYGEEPFWGVRIELAESLANANKQVAVDGLAGLLASEIDPMVLVWLIRAAGRIRDAGIRAALLARVEAGQLGYLAQGAAYEALGAQRSDAPFELLLAAAQRDAFGGYAQGGAFGGLAASRQEGALDALLDGVVVGAVSNNARPAAVGALGRLTKGLERQERARGVEGLVDRLRDPNYRVRITAARALAAAGAVEASQALDAFGDGLPVQERSMVNRLLHGVREQARAKAPKAETSKELEELKTALRALEERLQKVESRGNEAMTPGGHGASES